VESPASAVPRPLNSSQLAQNQSEEIPVIGYFVSITKCGGKKISRELFDAASVLKRSIEHNSYPFNQKARYRSSINVFVSVRDPQNRQCIEELDAIGYTILPRDSPVNSSEIGGNGFLRKVIDSDGCCGTAELMKLYIYEMEEYLVAVHLDFDSLVLQPLDELFDVIAYPPDTPKGKEARNRLVPLVAPTYKYSKSLESATINAFYTRDYYGLKKAKDAKAVGLQGGFLVVRPNRSVLGQIISMIKSGNYKQGRNSAKSGWFGSGYGQHIYGSMTIQGFMAYYFSHVDQKRSVELHRCKFNQIADNPRFTVGWRKPRPTPINSSAAGFQDGSCRDTRPNCDDVQCQTWPLEDTRLIHFTGGCRLPWYCDKFDQGQFLNAETCSKMYKAWFEIRHDIEPGEVELKEGTFREHIYRAYCTEDGMYNPINKSLVMDAYNKSSNKFFIDDLT
jgi:hypothetical protein